MNNILLRLQEKSTYAGVLALLSACGLVIDPAIFGHASTILISLVGLYENVRREKK
jgi:hypothetical protein